MARKSRKQIPEQPQAKNPYAFIAGGYIRVSVSENTSIENQKLIIQSFVGKSTDVLLRKFYIDDGKSSFINNRQAFYELISDIEKKVINCVIVKDISRFGRDDLEVAAYIQKKFPVYGARFIAITDDYDSHSDAENQDFSFLLKNIIR